MCLCVRVCEHVILINFNCYTFGKPGLRQGLAIAATQCLSMPQACPKLDFLIAARLGWVLDRGQID